MGINHSLKKVISYGIFISAMCLVFSLTVYFFVSRTLVKNAEDSLKETARQGARVVEEQVMAYIEVLGAIANISQIKDTSTTLEEKLKVLETEVERKKLKRISIADTNGNSKTTDGSSLYVGDRDYFKKALSGVKNISDPIVSRVDGTLVMAFAVPVTNENRVISILYATFDVEALCDITEDIRMGEEGQSFIVNKSGRIITHTVENQLHLTESIFDRAGKDVKGLIPSDPLKLLVEGKAGVEEYIDDDVVKYMGFSPIRGTEWSLVVTAPKSQVFKTINSILAFIFTAALAMLVIFSLMGLYTNYLKVHLDETQHMFSHAINAAGIIIIRLDWEGKILAFNKYAEQATKLSKSDVVGKMDMPSLVPDGYKEKAVELLGKLDREDNMNNFEIPLTCKDGEIIYVLWSYGKPKETKYNSNFFDLMGIDITERVKVEKKLMISNEELSASREELKIKYEELYKSKEQLKISEERFRLSAEGSNDILWNWDLKRNIVYFSDRWYEALEYEIGEIGADFDTWMSLLHPDDKEITLEAVEKNISGEISTFSCEYRLKTKSGYYKWFFARGKAQMNVKGEIVWMAGSITDVTRQKEYEQSIIKLAYFDTLTGLPNRSELRKRLEMHMAENVGKAAVIFLDIDDFKFINDSYGHSIGDRVIVEVGKRLRTIITEGGILVRQSGDEFTILLGKVASREEIIEFAESIIDCFEKGFDFGDIAFNLSVSAGIAVFPDDGENFEELTKNADTALYKAKDLGKKNYVFFEKSMNDAFVERIVLESNLRKALTNNEFILYYQPQVNAVTGRIVGFEALIRWISPELGFVSPIKFIFAAEESGLIVPIGKWVLKTACLFIKKLVSEGNEDLKVSVNISVIQLMQDDFVDVVLNTLQETQLDPGHLGIEITETVLMESFESNLKKLGQLRERGIKVSLDDFGKGYSSLTYLKQLPIDTLKIDKTFIDDILNDKGLTESIVMIAHKMGLSVVAEGVETREQLEHLTRSSCNIIQGYLFSKPVPEHDIVSLINKDFNT